MGVTLSGGNCFIGGNIFKKFDCALHVHKRLFLDTRGLMDIYSNFVGACHGLPSPLVLHYILLATTKLVTVDTRLDRVVWYRGGTVLLGAIFI